MKLVFALIVMVNGTIDAETISYWHDLNRCKYFADSLTTAPVKAYCVPKFRDPAKVEVHT